MTLMAWRWWSDTGETDNFWHFPRGGGACVVGTGFPTTKSPPTWTRHPSLTPASQYLILSFSRLLPECCRHSSLRRSRAMIRGVTFCHPRFGGAVCVTSSVARWCFLTTPAPTIAAVVPVGSVLAALRVARQEKLCPGAKQSLQGRGAAHTAVPWEHTVWQFL